MALGVSIAVVALVTPQTAAFAAAKAGGSCKVVGQSSGTLVCATKGKKNVWAVGKAPIKLMTLTSETGPMMFPEVAASAKAAAKAINISGGVSGRMIEIITCDDKLTPEAGADCARKAVSEKVTAVVGASTGVSGDAYMPILEKAGIPSVANIPNSTAETTSPLSYPISSSALLIVAGGSVLKAAGSTKVQYLGPNIPAFVGLMQLVEPSTIGTLLLAPAVNDVIGFEIGDKTPEIMKAIIAREVLGASSPHTSSRRLVATGVVRKDLPCSRLH